ncbi:MAG: tol-pal system protein YbgF [Gemmatimonadetes bacterium]|nr:tol-pal system protein YbgF [Gemmatimonadota bacterium]
MTGVALDRPVMASRLGVRRGLRRTLRLAPLLFLPGAVGCFATRGDVRVLQGDIATVRADLMRSQQEHRDALAKVAASLQVVSDSLARVGARTVSIQGDARGDMRAIRDQLLQLQQLLGQNQATIARLRAEMEARTNALAAQQQAPPVGTPPAGAPPAGTVPPGTVAPPAGSSATGTVPPAGGARPDSSVPAANQPGPNQLYTAGLDLLRRGSTATARATFQELLLTYPQFDLAADAQFYIAESLEREKNTAAAETAYAAVVATYPTANIAPRALYRRGLMVLEKGNTAQAKQLLEQVIAKYPRSDEATLAADRLKTIR